MGWREEVWPAPHNPPVYLLWWPLSGEILRSWGSSFPFIFNSPKAKSAKIRGHTARASLLRGEPSDWAYEPYPDDSCQRSSRKIGLADRLKAKGAMYTPSSLWTWLFLVVTGVQAAIVLGFESYVSQSIQFNKHHSSPCKNFRYSRVALMYTS